MRNEVLSKLGRTAVGLALAVLLVLPAAANQSGLQVPTTGPLPGLTLVNDTNAALQTLVTLQSGGSAPTALGLGLSDMKGVAWHDTNSNQIKIRNQADTAWISLFQIDETNNFATPTLPLVASATNQTIGAGNHAAAFVATGSATYTLNQTSTLPAGASFSIFAQGGPVTISINGSDKINNGGAGAGMAIPIGYVSTFNTDGAGNWWVTTERGAIASGTIASAATTDIGSLGASAVTISGTTTITSFGSSAQAGQVFFVTFSGALQLTYNATSMILNTGGASYTTSGGDRALVRALGSSDFEVTLFKAAGPVTNAADVQVFTTSGAHTWTKPAFGTVTTVYVIGGGGGGGGGSSGSSSGNSGSGGGGAACVQQYFSTSVLASSVTVTVGAGGNGGASNTAGTAGGNTTFGALLTGYGGGKGTPGATSATSGGGGGGGLGAGGDGSGTMAGTAGSFGGGSGGSGGSGGYSAGGSANSPCGGGGGGGAPYAGINGTAGGSALYGGGGGGGGGGQNNASGGAGGSTAAGSGGAGGTGNVTLPTAGGTPMATSAYSGGPGGGAGGSSQSGVGGAGGAGVQGGGGGGGGGGSGTGGTGGAGGTGLAVMITQ